MECQYIRNRIWMIKKMCNNMTEQEYIKKQLDLKNKIERTNTVDLGRLETVAGVDLAYWEQDGREYAVCCIVVINYRTFEIIEKVSHKDMISVPYIPGCLAFREIPLFMETYKQLKLIPDVVFFDGNGYLHPRHMGLATHAGLEGQQLALQKATIKWQTWILICLKTKKGHLQILRLMVKFMDGYCEHMQM